MSYAKGRRFEYAVRDALIGDGYEVLRSAGSKTKIDLVAIKRDELLFVQCKEDGRCSPAERTKLIELAQMVEALPIVALKTHEGRRVGIGCRLLTGPGPKEWTLWAADWGIKDVA